MAGRTYRCWKSCGVLCMGTVWVRVCQEVAGGLFRYVRYLQLLSKSGLYMFRTRLYGVGA